jgi:hypothetical protein
VPYLTSKLAMDEVAYGLLALLTKTTLVDKGKSPSPPPGLLRLSIVRVLPKAAVQVKKQYKVESLPSKCNQIVTYCNSSALQTRDYVLGTITLYLSLSERFSKSIKDQGMQPKTQAPNLGLT